MEKIKRLWVFNYLRNGEHFQLHWTLVDFLKDKVTDFTSLTTVFATYKRLFEHEDIVFKHNARMVGTAEIKAADKVRGDAFRALRMTVKALTKNINLPNRKLANDLLLIIDNFKKAPYKAYMENTAYISNLVEELQLPANQTKVEELLLDGLVTALYESNILFRTLYNNRSEWLEAQKKQGNMEDIRRPLDIAFRNVASAINTFYEFNELGEKNATTRSKLEAMIEGVNAHIDNALRAIAYRSPGQGSKPEPHPEPEPGPIIPYRFTARSTLFINGRILAVSPTDFDEFAASIDVRMIGGIMDFHPDGRSNRFTLDEISYDETDSTPMSLRFIPTDDQDLLGTLSDETYTVEVVKDEVVVLTIDEVKEAEGLA
jgi:hypothetical protein